MGYRPLIGHPIGPIFNEVLPPGPGDGQALEETEGLRPGLAQVQGTVTCKPCHLNCSCFIQSQMVGVKGGGSLHLSFSPVSF
jgi:hypothetical protein